MTITLKCKKVSVETDFFSRNQVVEIEGLEDSTILPHLDEEAIRDYMESRGYVVTVKREAAA